MSNVNHSIAFHTNWFVQSLHLTNQSSFQPIRYALHSSFFSAKKRESLELCLSQKIMQEGYLITATRGYLQLACSGPSFTFIPDSKCHESRLRNFVIASSLQWSRSRTVMPRGGSSSLFLAMNGTVWLQRRSLESMAPSFKITPLGTALTTNLSRLNRACNEDPHNRV